MKQQIFISSVQSEFLVERRALHAFIKDDPLLNKFFKPFVFEIDVPANDQRPDEIYLNEVARSTIYLGIFGDQYGWQNDDGISPTHLEFNEASHCGKKRLVYVRGAKDTCKQENMRKLISEVGPQLIRRRFNSYEELKSAVNASLIRHLEETGIIQSLPFDERICPDAALDDIDPKAIRQFIRLAHNKRQFSLPDSTQVTDVLAHLNLIREGHPTQAAVLLFATKTQQFVSCSEIRCMHFHGTTIQRPAPFYQTFQGTLFEQVDKAVDFILSKINLSVGIRAESTQAPTRYEVPPEVIREAIVNAVAHRDYVQPGAIQVSVFADRIEVWNPGELLAPLTIEKLRKPHRSLTRNARICEALYLVGYIEKFGTGTLMMIRESLKHALPEPDFDHETGEFVTILWRDWLTEKVMAGLHLNDRQRHTVDHLKLRDSITNSEYQDLHNVSKRTAHRDLVEMVNKEILVKQGTTGKGVSYHLSKGVAKGPKGP